MPYEGDDRDNKKYHGPSQPYPDNANTTQMFYNINIIVFCLQYPPHDLTHAFHGRELDDVYTPIKEGRGCGGRREKYFCWYERVVDHFLVLEQ